MKITVISVLGNVYRVQFDPDRVKDGVFHWYTSWGHSEKAKLADEGVAWIRGWHDDDSDEVKALLVARALGPAKAIELEKASRDFIAGVMSEEAWKANLDLFDGEMERR